MKFPPAPILALLAFEGACALAPPTAHSGQGGDPDPTTQSSAVSGGSSGGSRTGGSSAAATASGGVTARGGTVVTGGTLATGGSIATGGAPATGGATPSGGITPNGGSASGGTATGGRTTGGSMAGGTTAATGGTMAGGGSMPSGGTNARGGTVASGGMASGGMASGGSATGGSTSTGNTHAQPPPITGGSSGFATRYWDCCKPSCGWSANTNGKPPVHTCGKDGTSTVGNDTQSACSGGSGYTCYWGVPWSVSDTLSYGFAAYNGVACGTCFQLQFTGKGQYNGNDPGSVAINGKTMIVQIINIGGIGANQFDLLIPGGGVGANNACTGGSAQWSGADIGDTNGGMLTTCKDDKSCVQQKCQAAFGNKPQLLEGCNWVTGWFSAADNPQLLYKQIACPSDISAKSGE